MFNNTDLTNHLQTSSSIKVQAQIVAEWNMNTFDNISYIGNYRYRPLALDGESYKVIASSFSETDTNNDYTDATYADVIIDAGLDNEGVPLTFKSNKEKERLLYSLEDCFGKFRPRSGINKLRYFDSSYTHYANRNMAQRPRYYMAHKDDQFKYWSSFRTENGTERGVAINKSSGKFYIDDAAPFVVYKESVPANRLVVKMQTNVGDINLGPFSDNGITFNDPFYGLDNASVPVDWKIQILNSQNQWVDAISFNQNSLRPSEEPVINVDGYVEIGYGLLVPEQYQDIFIYAGTYSNINAIPVKAIEGYAYLIKSSDTDPGTFYIYTSGEFETFPAEYGWYLFDEGSKFTPYTNTLVNPESFVVDEQTKYREFEYINGIRVVAETMKKQDSTLDIIEMSPRLASNITDKIQSTRVTKIASDIGTTGLPIGELLASTGSLEIFDYDQAFNTNNTDSIISSHLNKNIQFKIYENILDVDGYDYQVPVKVLYSEKFPQLNNANRTASFELRDLFFYFESITAPQILIKDASLSYAVSMLLDSIGFSNYGFRRVSGEIDPVIPYFFVSPDKTLAEVLNEIAMSTQSSMFFDEYNNFIVATKNYMIPTESERATNITLRGSKDFEDAGILENSTTNNQISNIMDVSSQDNLIYNAGTINYTSRYIQRSYRTIKQASLIDNDKTWIYKPVLLWEIAGTENTKSINDESNSQSNYVLSAIPLNSDLSASVPTVSNRQVINNTMDLGEGIYWISRYNGYFYANSEVIKYDAVQYSIPGSSLGNFWITSQQEYSDYFSRIPFNGKMYPTGLVRIYSEPNYEVVDGQTVLKNGDVAKHGRGQFGTPVVAHSAGLNEHWSNDNNVRGCEMESKYIFTSAKSSTKPGPTASGISNTLAKASARTGILKNFLSSATISESEANRLLSTQTGTMQSSAFIMNGPLFSGSTKPLDFVSYVYKPLSDSYRHFGTRMRVIGKLATNILDGQNPSGSSVYYSPTSTLSSQASNIGGASGGIAVMLNPETNVGYYFEIVALTETNIEDYVGAEEIHNLIFYKVGGTGQTKATPEKLWGGLGKIIVDDGKFTGQYRMTGEENPTVYDLAVEYIDSGSTRTFYLYVNNKLVATVQDANPLPVYNNMALFVRGSARVMFENIYALTTDYAQHESSLIDTPVNSIFGDPEISVSDSLRRYAMSGVIQSTYLSSIGTSEPPKYRMYFEEFGTIMREAAYFNVRYDKAYPSLYAKISPTFNKLKGYTVSGFMAGAYGAEFMVFNATDTALSLDETSGNYLRIQGVTFTQQSEHQLTVDEYFSKKSDLSRPELIENNESPVVANQMYQDIKNSRLTYGKNEFSIDAPYIQNSDNANDLMKWMINKIMKPRKSVGMRVFGLPIIQLGDIVEIDYTSTFDEIAISGTRFVVYNIEYSQGTSGPENTIYLSEVM